MSKILIVDDEVRIRDVVSEYAVAHGYHVKQASDGLEALKMIETEKFDLILLDIMMPNLDGFSACKQIKAKQDVPVIMLSARF